MENPCVECYQEVVDNVDIVFKQIQFKRKCASTSDEVSLV